MKVYALDEAHRTAGLDRIRASAALACSDPGEREGVLARITVTTALHALGSVDFLIEAIPERLEAKRALFAELSTICHPDAIVATNTSSLPVIEMAAAHARPDRVVGLHFFNPAPAMKLVELAVTVATAPQVRDCARAFAESLGKTVLICRDRSGFIANLLLFPYLNEAAKLLDSGYASREDIDAAMRLGAGHPMGPLELIDLIGLDSCLQIMESLHRQFAEPRFTPPPALRELCTAGFTGRKAGRGFYTYGEPSDSERPQERVSPSLGSPPPSSRRVEVLGIVGTGTVGSGVAEVAAGSGFEVLCWGRSDDSCTRARQRVERSTQAAVDRGKLEPGERDAALARITWTRHLPDLARADLVIEAVPEDLDIKRCIFREIGEIVAPDATVATSTSSLPIIELASETGRAERVLGLHFFNPVPVMRLVEIARTVATAEEAVSIAADCVERMGKAWVLCKDRAGFIVNRLLFPYLNDAVRMLEEGYASAEDIDLAMTLGCNHPMGPLALLDLVGLDVAMQILHSLHRELQEPSYAPAPLLEQMAGAGYLGRKSGRGFRFGASPD